MLHLRLFDVFVIIFDPIFPRLSFLNSLIKIFADSAFFQKYIVRLSVAVEEPTDRFAIRMGNAGVAFHDEACNFA